MDYQVDLDPTHSVIRLTVTAETVTRELAEDIYRHLSEVGSSGGPYAAIYDLSAVKHTTMLTETVRGFALRRPAIPMGRKQVAVGKEQSRVSAPASRKSSSHERSAKHRRLSRSANVESGAWT
jgi:hypothetical protein